MPNVGGRAGGGFKPSSRPKGGGFKPPSGKGAARKDTLTRSLNQRGQRPLRSRQGFQDEDMPLSPDDEIEVEEEQVASGQSLAPVEPFSDGIVARQFRGLVIVPRVGGEECSVLADFLTVYSRTTPFIGSINQKTSYMKKQGGRLL